VGSEDPGEHDSIPGVPSADTTALTEFARRQLHKIRNVSDKCRSGYAPRWNRRMRQAYHTESAVPAQTQLHALAREPDKTHSGAAASLREGLEETLIVLRFEVSPALARTLSKRTRSSR
jgi:putative transposase